jgi:hypothetical protein
MFGVVMINYPYSFVRSNVFYAPYVPSVTFYLNSGWQVNDPLVHYTLSDVAYNANPPGTISTVASPSNLGLMNNRYEPWGGNPVAGRSSPTVFDPSVKDAMVRSSENWDFPSGEPLSFGTIGRVHRGTPWQTVFLRATNDITSLSGSPGPRLPVWMNWTGDKNLLDAMLMSPVMDRRMLDTLAPMLNTHDLHSLLSINSSDPGAWESAMDGIEVLTNALPDNQLLGVVLAGGVEGAMPLAPLTMSSNSPEAAEIAGAILAARASQPGGVFHNLSDLLSIRQLSDQSPWLNWSDPVQQQYGITDEAYEAIASQLLSRVRADSIGTLSLSGGVLNAQFSGVDEHAYRVEVSTDLVTWFGVSTNYPTNGVFRFTESMPVNEGQRFYRSVLLR